jgi:hypothetical protein
MEDAVNWHTQLRTHGYAHFPGLTQASLAPAAREAIDIAVYFRVWLRDLGERRWECLTNIWEGWKI